MSTRESNPGSDHSETLRDQDISVERTVGRRSFLAATGVLLGAAVALASGCTDPDRQRKPAQPNTAHDAEKHSDPDPRPAPPPAPRP